VGELLRSVDDDDADLHQVAALGCEQVHTRAVLQKMRRRSPLRARRQAVPVRLTSRLGRNHTDTAAEPITGS
jgi:hypothetical protein